MSNNGPQWPGIGQGLNLCWGGRHGSSTRKRAAEADLPSLAHRAHVRQSRAAELGLWMLLAVAAALSTGCGLLAQQTQVPRPSTSIQGFMQQPRPGDGVIGP